MRRWYLSRTVGRWSAGTPVEVIDHPSWRRLPRGVVEHGFATVRVEGEVIDVPAGELVQRRDRSPSPREEEVA